MLLSNKLVMKKSVLLFFIVIVCENEAARILAYYPSPSISHQVVFRPLTLELAKRGHEIVVLTTDPIFPNKDGPGNLQEIDLHDLSYGLWRKYITKMKNNFDRNAFDQFTLVVLELLEAQLLSDDVQMILKDKTKSFDLIIVEAFMEGALGLKHLYKAPVIQFSSLSSTMQSFNIFGAPIHPFLYPVPFNEKLYNLTVWDKMDELYYAYKFDRIIPKHMGSYEKMLKRVFGSDVPAFNELRSNVDMLFLNVHSVWDSNRPVPPNIIYLGGLHQKPQKELPKELQTYLDSSKNGVIYISFGSNVDPTMFPEEKIQIFIKVFSKLPYDVIWKWNHDELPGRTENIKISKWLPQSDLLRHPKVKLFITQGGLQSTDEAITAGVPLIGVPIFGDQRFNVEQYLHFGIGERVELETISEEKLSNTINAVLGTDKYRKNMEKLQLIINDQPQTPLERAVWWTEYVIRHKGAKHLRSPAANMSLYEYYEVELVLCVLLGPIVGITVLISLAYLKCFRKGGKVKQN